jgi:DNA-binding GntR family transcriptional regulator
MKENLSDYVYNEITEEIVSGLITQDSILNESALIDKLKVSKTPIREALVRLCNEDVLISIPRFGYQLKAISHDYFKGIIRFREIVEPHYLNLYFDSIKPEHTAALKKTILMVDRDKVNTPSEYWTLTSQFHLQLAFFYHDEFFYETLKIILHKQLIAFSKLYWNNWSSIVESKISDNHANILDAIVRGDKQGAAQAMKADILSA